ncbi:MAG: MBOAT family protein [Cyanobacteriota bacterium]
MFHVDYPPYMPNLNFIAGILTVLAVNYYVNLRKIPDSYKWGFTIFCFILLLIFPIPFFKENRLFGSIPTGLSDYRSYPPFTLVSYIIILFKYYSIQFNAIKAPQNAPGLKFVMTFIFLLPNYVMNYGPEGIKAKEPEKAKKENRILMFKYLVQFVISYLFIVLFFVFVPIPWNAIASCFKGFSSIPIITGAGLIVIAMFIIGSSTFSFVSAFYNTLGGYDFKFYQNKAFIATSVGDFWKRWNLWGNEWFNIYMYKPLRRKYKFSHIQAMLSIFLFSGLIHAYVISMINPYFAWLTFFIFFINGLVLAIEKPVIEKFPFITKLPKPVKFLLTFIYLDITLGLFGLCFTKWP